MSFTLAQRVAAHFRASMSPDPERRHKEIMTALQAADYDEWERMESARKEVPDWWAMQMVNLEREIEEVNKGYTPEGDFPECSSKLARENLESGRWRLQRPAIVVYTVLGIRPDTTMGLVLDALYTATRLQRYFDETVPYFAAKWGISEVSVWRCLGHLRREGVLIRTPRPGKSSLLALNFEEIYRRVNIYENGGDEALFLDKKEREKDKQVKTFRSLEEDEDQNEW